MRRIRLNESEFRRLINESVIRCLMEYMGDDEEYGRYDLEAITDDEPVGKITPDELNAHWENLEDNQYMGREYWDPMNN